MENLKRLIEEYCREHQETMIFFIVGFPLYRSETFNFPRKRCRTLLGPSDLDLLDYEIDTITHGGRVDPFYIWTDKSVLFWMEYDGQGRLGRVPRDPVVCNPIDPWDYTLAGK